MHRGTIAFWSMAFFVAVLGPVTPLRAQGSSVDQQSACMAARVSAGVAQPCGDGSAVYYNPAALALHPTVLGLGVSMVRTGNTFTYQSGGTTIERDTEVIPVPHAYASYRVSPRLALAMGDWRPYGLGLAWPVCPVAEPVCGEPNFEGRYTGYDNALRGLYLQPTVAYQVVPGRVAIGLGIDAVRGSFEIHQRSDAPQLGLTGRDIADIALRGHGWGVTGHVGVIVQLTPEVSLGARYLHSVEIDLDGKADFTQVSTGSAAADALIAPQFAPTGPLHDQAIAAAFELPAQFVAGLAVQPITPLTLFADYQWTQWSTFNRIPVDFEDLPAQGDRSLDLGYSNTNTFKFGAEFVATPELSLQAGLRLDSAASPYATPFLPENKRTIFSLGAGFQVPIGLRADLALQYIAQPDREGTVRPGGPIAGTYTSTGQIFALILSQRVGRSE